MPALEFDGSDDYVGWTSLLSELQDTGASVGWTVAVLCKRGHSGSFWEGLCTKQELGASSIQVNIGFNGGGGGGLADSIYSDDLGTPANTSSTFTNTTDPYLFVLSKGDGTVAPRLGWKLGSGGSWTHENLDDTVPDTDTGSLELYIGGNPVFSEHFQGHLGVVAIWEGPMSDANKEALDNNWATSDLFQSAHGTPRFLVECNVAATSLVDLVENASSREVQGTTLDEAEDLDSWNFDGYGASLTALRPDADVDAASWDTAPLWSKIEEESADGTVVTDTAA